MATSEPSLILGVQDFQVNRAAQDEREVDSKLHPHFEPIHRHSHRGTQNILEKNDWLGHEQSFGRSILVDADAGVRHEKMMDFRTALRFYLRAMSWSALVMCSIIMIAYDKSLVGGFLALPAFKRRYGTRLPGLDSETYEVSPHWQTGLQNGQVCGEIMGLLIHGIATDHFGYRKAMLTTMGWLVISNLISFLARSLVALLVAQVLSGLSWGILSVMAASYAADILPVALRSFMLSNVNMCWLMGQLIGTSVLQAFVHVDTDHAWRVPLALQWLWSVPLLIVYWFAPESPWWLIRHERPSAAYNSLLRLTSEEFHDRSQTIAMMIKTNERELRFDSAKPAFKHCFEPFNIRRTSIVSMVWVTQAMCGSTLTGYAPLFYEQAGLDSKNAFRLSMGMYAMGIMGNMICWLLLRACGRRTLYISGLGVSFALLLVGGLISIPPVPNIPRMWTLGSLVIFMTFVYDMTIGPICYILVAEIPSTRLRLKSIVIARIAYNLALVINNSVTPRMLNPELWALKGKTCLVFAVTCLVCLLWAYFYLPETRKLAYIEIDILFEKKAPAKKFREFQQRLENSGYVSVRVRETTMSAWHGSRGFA